MMEFQALRVFEEDGAFVSRLVRRAVDELPPGDVVIRVEYSSLNYKDALSLTGNRGVTRKYPHTPGIDAAGVVLSSSVSAFAAGDRVLVTGYDLGMNTDGGYGQVIRVPAAWVLPLPVKWDTRTAMMLGTAGLTAALCVDSLLQVGIAPEQGEVLVTGASGGVGVIAVMLLAQQGFRVVAASGKADRVEWLKKLGASDVINRDALLEGSGKPMLKERWAGVVDTVGGDVLANVIKATRYGGSVACCGMVAGASFTSSVFPFILRGVNLLGVDSVELPREIKQQMWDILAHEWRLPLLDAAVEEVTLAQVPEYAARILQGSVAGRVLVRVAP